MFQEATVSLNGLKLNEMIESKVNDIHCEYTSVKINSLSYTI